jgi:hypothetical protein
MQSACMPKHIQIRDLDSKLYGVLAKRAKEQGISLSQFLRNELTRIAKTPLMADVLEELINLPREQSKWKLGEAARLVRESRDERDERLDILLEKRKWTDKKAS